MFFEYFLEIYNECLNIKIITVKGTFSLIHLKIHFKHIILLFLAISEATLEMLFSEMSLQDMIKIW